MTMGLLTLRTESVHSRDADKIVKLPFNGGPFNSTVKDFRSFTLLNTSVSGETVMLRPAGPFTIALYVEFPSPTFVTIRLKTAEIFGAGSSCTKAMDG